MYYTRTLALHSPRSEGVQYASTASFFVAMVYFMVSWYISISWFPTTLLGLHITRRPSLARDRCYDFPVAFAALARILAPTFLTF